MIERACTHYFLRLARQFPVVLITGPRQSGKTTLARSTFPDLPYTSLENLDSALRAESDPRGFLGTFPDGGTLDEIQRAPGLLSYLQQIVDEDPRPGRFILTGSQQFGLLGAATQSLAGRASLLELLPFSLAEAASGWPDAVRDLDTNIHRGWFPPIFDRVLDPELWSEAYIATYLERDVLQILNIKDMSAFRRFLALCAGRTAQLVNLSEFAGDCGVSHVTIKAWLSVLEASYILRLVPAFHTNFNKRLVKSPKLHILDTGLAARLLGIRESAQLSTHPARGALFESFIFAELSKLRLNTHAAWDIYSWRDQSGHEVDFILSGPCGLFAIEVKSGQTFHPDHVRSLLRFREIAGSELTGATLVYGGSDAFAYKDIRVAPWNDIGSWGLPS
jgi:predicted AAA+ superfamily ATPase